MKWTEWKNHWIKNGDYKWAEANGILQILFILNIINSEEDKTLNTTGMFIENEVFRFKWLSEIKDE